MTPLYETVSAVPSGLIACEADGRQVHISAISPRALLLRTNAPLPDKAQLKLYFYHPERGNYTAIKTTSMQTGPAQRENHAVLTRFSLESPQIAAEIRRALNSYARFVETRGEYGASSYGRELTGYPTEQDEIFLDSIEEQYQTWFGSCPPLLPEGCSCEIAVLLDMPKLWEAYLNCPANAFWDSYASLRHLPRQVLPVAPVQRLYIGSESCPHLFPEPQILAQIFQKADSEGVRITIATAQLRALHIRNANALLDYLSARGEKTELIANDWGMLERLQACRDWAKPVLGTLLNKRRKDPRMQWKAGFDASKHLLVENALNNASYRAFLQDLGIERYEYEACSVPLRIPKGGHSLHLPFYRTNSAAWCTLKAACENGDRGSQAPAESCPGWCTGNTCLYPLHLRMIGRGNSLFALENRFPVEIPTGIDRIVFNF